MTSTVPPDGVSLHRYPGTSCLATISLSLRGQKPFAHRSATQLPLALMGMIGVQTGCTPQTFRDKKTSLT
jgi:hypothetical protein